VAACGPVLVSVVFFLGVWGGDELDRWLERSLMGRS
jgi:hypothetical protein